MLLYRLTRSIYANDLSGSGARLYGGRWNSEGRSMLYLAGSRALAVLEALVHVRPTDFPNEYSMLTLDAPDDIAEVDLSRLPPHWKDDTDIDSVKQTGNNFLLERKHLLLKVPSAIVDDEFNYLLNPLHPSAQKIKLISVKPFSFDSRLARQNSL